MNRRQFLQTIAITAVAGPALADTETKALPHRVLGRTGIEVPILAFGSGSRFLMYKEEDQALEALSKALDLGICYIDTAHSYGNGRSEERIGKLMPARRKQVVLATKIGARKADDARREIELSLKRLQTDHLDVLHIHALKDADDLKAIEAKGGVLEAMHEAREKKIARAIGITCHASPTALRDALEHNDFDCTQMALNAGMASMAEGKGGMKATPAGASSFEKLALPVAQSKKMGIIAMKVFGQEQLIGSVTAEKLLLYSLSLPVSLASVGMPKMEHIEANAALARNFKPLSQSERHEIEKSIAPARKTAMLNFFANHHDC
jgi:uncharacterized protein